jgi:hypothetical protein
MLYFKAMDNSSQKGTNVEYFCLSYPISLFMNNLPYK